MNALLEDVLVAFPVGPVKTSRLVRSNSNIGKFDTLEKVRDFCDKHNIPYELPADFIDRVLPSAALQETFARSYGLTPLPPTTLRHKGESIIIALERQIPEPYCDMHGEVIATIAQTVGSLLEPAVKVIYIKADPNRSYRDVFQQPISAALSELLDGVAVSFCSVGWDDVNLTFDGGTHDQFDFEHSWKIPGFAVNCVGNDGLCGGAFGVGKFGAFGGVTRPVQKHSAYYHAPPLAVSVGAVVQTENGRGISGNNSVAGPTFHVLLPKDALIKWDRKKDLEPVEGSSATDPQASTVLAALNARYGAYLTREQILFAVIATCEPETQVLACGNYTPQPYAIEYKANAAGLPFNGVVGGFGTVNVYKADHLLAHMVAMTQDDPDSITVPTEERLELFVQNAASHKRVDGNYVYELELPADATGYALKTTLEVEYVDRYGQISVTSPSGTTYPMVTSVLPIFNIAGIPEGKASYGISTGHGWTGEDLSGKWRIVSTTPIRRLRLNNHHFLEGDVIHNLDVATLLKTPIPYDKLATAIPLVDLKPTLRVLNHVALQPANQMHAMAG